jgi:hypothetical protein
MAINTHRHMIHETTRIYNESWAISDMALFEGRLLHYVDTSSTWEQYMELNYTQIGLSIADITVV